MLATSVKVQRFKDWEAEFHRALWDEIKKDQRDKPEPMEELEGRNDNTSGAKLFDTREELESTEGTSQNRVSKAKVADGDKESLSYGNIHFYLAKLVMAQPDALQRLKTRFSAAQKAQLGDLLKVENVKEEDIEEEEDDGLASMLGLEGAKKKGESDLDRLLALMRLLRTGGWQGKLMRRLPEATEQEGNEAPNLTDEETSVPEEWPDFPFAKLLERVIRQVGLTRDEIFGEEHMKVKVKARDPEESLLDLREVVSEEKVRLGELLYLVNQMLYADWKSPWMWAKLTEEVGVTEAANIDTLERPSLTFSSHSSDHDTDSTRGKHRSAEGGGLEFPKPCYRPCEPPSKLSPVTEWLQMLVDFICVDQEVTLDMLLLSDEKRGRALVIIDTVYTNGRGEPKQELTSDIETQDFHRFRELLAILSKGQWQDRASLKYAQRNPSLWNDAKREYLRKYPPKIPTALMPNVRKPLTMRRPRGPALFSFASGELRPMLPHHPVLRAFQATYMPRLLIAVPREESREPQIWNERDADVAEMAENESQTWNKDLDPSMMRYMKEHLWEQMNEMRIGE